MATYNRPSIKSKNPWVPLILVALLGATVLLVKLCKRGADTGTTKQTTEKGGGSTRGLNRNPTYINYSKHAKCRMACRHIDESEVKEILRDGNINYRKSELDGEECKRKYAVEGLTHDHQKVRIIFAPCNTEVTVVTVIDIGQEWPCDCQ